MSGRPYVLAETSWRTVSGQSFDVAILPWGATEAHNYHLPYGTDTVQSEHIACEAARLAWEGGARVVVLPTIPYGVQTGQLDIPMCLNVNPSTQAALLADLVHSLEVQGVRKLVILNGHGGNDFRSIVRELQPGVEVFLCVVDWYRVVDGSTYFDVPGDHAGEMETSVMMHISPKLVLPLEQAGAGRERRFRIAALRDGWAWAPRSWTRISDDTGVGDPAAATPEKGASFVTAVSDRIASFLIQLAATDLQDLYESGEPGDE